MHNNNIINVNFRLCFTEILGFGPSKVIVNLYYILTNTMVKYGLEKKSPKLPLQIKCGVIVIQC